MLEFKDCFICALKIEGRNDKNDLEANRNDQNDQKIEKND